MDIIKSFGSEFDCRIGICAAAPLPDRDAPFISSDKEKRTRPDVLLPGVRCIIVLLMAHNPPTYTNLSTLGTNPDYHKPVKNALHQLAARLPSHAYKVLADSPYLDERALAVRAGLGFIGKNGLLIAPGMGSFLNIGCMLTDLDLPVSPPQEYDRPVLPLPISDKDIASPNAERDRSNGCPEDCRLCMDACPVRLKKSTCVSYLTQKKEELTEGEQDIVFKSKQLYGCDICQTICPFNTIKPPSAIFPAEDWLTADDESLNKTYSHTAMWWRGTEVMRRNARIQRR